MRYDHLCLLHQCHQRYLLLQNLYQQSVYCCQSPTRESKCQYLTDLSSVHIPTDRMGQLKAADRLPKSGSLSAAFKSYLNSILFTISSQASSSISSLRKSLLLSSSVIFRRTRQGFPAATDQSGISLVTTLPAPITT